VLLQEGRDLEQAERALRELIAMEAGNEEAKRNLEVLLRQKGDNTSIWQRILSVVWLRTPLARDAVGGWIGVRSHTTDKILCLGAHFDGHLMRTGKGGVYTYARA
jgi:hypothetical protein